jgi:large subunit ribosomal protein L15
MLKLHELAGDPGKTQKKRRVGRGEGSGWGRTAGKGNKGQQSRSGGGHKGAGFEGGQMPLIRRLPKFGFSNIRFRAKKVELTLGQLNHFEEGATVDFAALVAKGLIPKQTEHVKVLATGELKRKLTVRLNGFTAKAREAIQAAGGTCETV